MKKFFKKILLIFVSFLLFFIVLVVLFSKLIENREFKNWETESNLLIMHPHTHYDVLLLGNSHSRNFSRHNNHQRVENILNKDILNFGRSGGITGYSDYLFYLQYAYSKNITFDTIVVNVFSQMLFSQSANIASNSFEQEPFRFDFLFQYFKYPFSENKLQKVFYYMRSKISLKWIFLNKPYSLNSKTDSLLEIDTIKVKKGFEIAFSDGLDTAVFNYNANIVEEIIQTAKKNGAVVVFITTPTLFGNWPHHDYVVDLMSYFKQVYNVDYYNFADSIPIPNYYYDHHHLNTKGVVKFVEEYLKPAVFDSK
ncbi:MAG: hypothetical protein JXR68_04930 [Bacteroidales bacterium]|nr:hypothetical protein [Bacteroidales bacterium]